MTCIISSLQSPYLDSELIETLCGSTLNEDRSSDCRAVSFTLLVYQLILSRLGMFHMTRKGRELQAYKNNTQGFYRALFSFKPCCCAAQGPLDL